jgi:hypothetical protein
VCAECSEGLGDPLIGLTGVLERNSDNVPLERYLKLKIAKGPPLAAHSVSVVAAHDLCLPRLT